MALRKKILYIHTAGVFGGSSRSLFEMLKAADLDGCEIFFLTQRGSVEEYFKKFGRVISVRGLSQFDHGRYSFYRGVRWLILLREIFYLPFLFFGLIRVRLLSKNLDIIHINDFVGLPAILFALILFESKIVVHVRSLVNSDAQLLRTRALNWILKNKVDSVVCIDETVRRTIDAKVDALIVHNGLGISEADQHQEVNYSAEQEPLRVGFVGNLLLQKGILDLVEAAAILKKDGISCQFLIYGHVTGGKKGAIASILEIAGIRQDVRLKVLALVNFYSLEDSFIFKGFSDDLEAAYKSFDLLCFPSHLDAPGRPVLEAAYFSRPSIVAVKNPTSDTIVNNVTGLTIQPHALNQLVDAIKVFHADRSLLKVMGRAAKNLSDREYDQEKNSVRIFKLYDSVISPEN